MPTGRSESHIGYYELFPTLDHVIPVARGGVDNHTNWVTTSMLRNNAKSNWMLAELGWSLLALDPNDEWDGLLGFFREYVASYSDVLADKYIKRWNRAAVEALASPELPPVTF